MNKKLLILLTPIIFFFSFCFWITEEGIQGRLDNHFLREKAFPALNRATALLTDIKFNFRGPQPVKNKIVVVEIDSPSIERLGRWPWHRDLTSFLIEKTFMSGAKVVGLDMVFSEPDPRVPEELKGILKQSNLGDAADKFETDPILKNVIQVYGDRLVLGWATDLVCQPYYEEPKFCPVTDPEAIKLFPPEFPNFTFKEITYAVPFDPQKTPLISYVTPLANISDYNTVAQHQGYFSAVLDADGYIRKTNLLAIAAGKPFPSLSMEMARVGLAEDLTVGFDQHFRVQHIGFAKSKRFIPVTPLGSMQINFRGPSSVFHHVSAEDILSDSEKIEDQANTALLGKTKAEVLKDAYVLIGLSALGVFDMRQFPFESNSPGVYGHANILDNLLSGDPLILGSSGTGTIWILVIMILGVFLFAFSVEKLNAIPALLLTLGVFAGIWYLDFAVFFKNNYNMNTSFLYVEISFVFIFTLAMKYIQEENNKKFIRSAFAKYVPPAVVDSILEDPTKLSLGGEKRELTILFSDIRGFTTFSEKMDAKALASFLNEYLGVMTGLVFSNQGTLDKYIGDAVMAFWGAPLNQPIHASNACKAAIEMMRALADLKPKFRERFGIEVDIGIGVNSGVVNVGNMGSEQNFEYTVIGDHVNLASRLEGLTKKYGVSIVTSRFTFDCITQSGQSIPPHRILDFVKVKGKKKAVELIQVLEKEFSSEGLKLFEKGRELYRACQWDQAAQTFQAANELLKPAPETSDGPCEMYIERCQYFKENPPAEDWDGSWEMDSK